MGARQRSLAAALAVVALAFAAVVAVLFALPASAPASDAQESILQDDDQLIYVSPSHMAHTLQQIAGLGVDRVKVSVVWYLIAPRPNSTHRPKFNATDPAAYPPGAWSRYDLLLQVAHQLGVKVYFQLGPRVPAWAVARQQSGGQGPILGHAPDPTQFRKFVEAVGRRYSGGYTPAGASAAIPRVDYWGVWNEPNERSWLNPWWRRLPGGGKALIQPALYRGLVDAAWRGLGASGHRGDTFLVGETANTGILTPLPFVRDLYCLGPGYRPLRGAAARHVQCPVSGNRQRFVAAHPGLFQATGYAHHPYGFDVPPNRRYPDPTFVTLYNVSGLERILNNILGAYGKLPSGGVPLYLTEWGYKSNPPNPFVRTSLPQQAAWLDEGAYMTWKSPFVRALSQFLLVDDRPKTQARVGSRLYWSTWQTGLVFRSGIRKPAYDAYRIPIWLPVQHHGASVTVWGQLRPADHASAQSAQLELEPSGSSTWSPLTTVTTNDPEGFFTDQVSIPSAGLVRLAWTNPANGSVEYSRSVSVG